MDPRRFLLPAIGVLVLLAVVALVVTRDDDHSGEEVRAGSGGATTTTEETTTTTTPVVVTTTTTAVPTTTTTARPATTTTVAAAAPAPPARDWSISPTSGPANSEFTASGRGCVGKDAGVGITQYDPNGQAYTGTGATALPDGTWRIPVNIGAVPPGRYTIKAACQGSNPFEYPQVHTYTVTG